MKKVHDHIVRPLYEEGLNDVEIAGAVCCNAEAIRYWRIKNKLKSNFNYVNTRKHDFSEVDKLILKNLSDLKISKLTGIPQMTIYFHRVNNNIFRKSLIFNEDILLSQRQKEIIIGCVFGDGYLGKSSTTSNTRFTCEHSLAQKEYNLWKCEELKSLGCVSKQNKRKTPDKRNGNIYESISIYTKANPALNYLQKCFYKDRKKRIPFEILDDYSALSLAVHYMDDGTKDNASYSFATQCFSKEDLINFQLFLKEKFDLYTSLSKNGEIYILHNSKNKFEKLVVPFIHTSMLYKIH